MKTKTKRILLAAGLGLLCLCGLTPAGATPTRTTLTFLPILAGDGVSAREVAALEQSVRRTIEGRRHFSVLGPAGLSPLSPSCRAQLGCVRASLPEARDNLTLDLRVARLGRVLTADLRLASSTGPIRRWRSTVAPGEPKGAHPAATEVAEALDTLLVAHTPDAVTYRRAREGDELWARNLLLRDYPDSAWSRALLRMEAAASPPEDEVEAVPAAGVPAATPMTPADGDEEAPGSPSWIEYLD